MTARYSDAEWLLWVKNETDEQSWALYHERHPPAHRNPRRNATEQLYQVIRERFVDPEWLEDLQEAKHIGVVPSHPNQASQPIRTRLATRYTELFHNALDAFFP